MSNDRALAAVQAAVALGGDVRAKNKGGRTALHGAANQGAGNVLRFLVEQGADINAKDSDGWTPLWTAQHSFLGASILVQPDSVKVLRELGAADIPGTLDIQIDGGSGRLEQLNTGRSQ